MFERRDYERYVSAFNARNYEVLETFFADDFALENAGFIVRGKPAFRAFYAFFHDYCRETVTIRRFFGGEDAFMVNVVIRFEGIKDLSAAVLAEKGYPGMTVIPRGVAVDVDFLILYELDADGKIRYIKGAVHEPARPVA
ncbi:MAG: hypothetical protein RLZZ200_80 [Pseudomonadota bacterium]